MEASDKLEPFQWSPFHSSKIKAALEVLQTLSKPSLSLPSLSSENSDPLSSGLEQYLLDNRKSDADNGVNESLKVAGEKAIVFSQWTRMLDLLESCLKDSSIQYRRLDGTMTVAARDKAVKDFNTLPEVCGLLYCFDVHDLLDFSSFGFAHSCLKVHRWIHSLEHLVSDGNLKILK